jgi:hypothetical protein
MQTYRSILSTSIKTAPEVIQFAKDRKFEESWVIPRDADRPTQLAIDTYLHKEPFKTIIVEYIWNADDDDSRFVLTVFLDETCELKDPKAFIRIALDAYYAYVDFSTLLHMLDFNVIGKEYLGSAPVESVNISIFNHWMSVGPEELWKMGDVYDKETVVQKIHGRSEIETSDLNYQGLFFRCNVHGTYPGPYYGIKTPCCVKTGSVWHVDYQKIDQWMRRMLGL